MSQDIRWPVCDAILKTKIPGPLNNFIVQSYRQTEHGEQNIPEGDRSIKSEMALFYAFPDWQIDQQRVGSALGSLSSEGLYDEEQVAQDGDQDGDHVQSDPTPMVLLREDVSAVVDLSVVTKFWKSLVFA